jgi:hypothetical protein
LHTGPQDSPIDSAALFPQSPPPPATPGQQPPQPQQSGEWRVHLDPGGSGGGAASGGGDGEAADADGGVRSASFRQMLADLQGTAPAPAQQMSAREDAETVGGASSSPPATTEPGPSQPQLSGPGRSGAQASGPRTEEEKEDEATAAAEGMDGLAGLPQDMVAHLTLPWKRPRKPKAAAPAKKAGGGGGGGAAAGWRGSGGRGSGGSGGSGGWGCDTLTQSMAPSVWVEQLAETWIIMVRRRGGWGGGAQARSRGSRTGAYLHLAMAPAPPDPASRRCSSAPTLAPPPRSTATWGTSSVRR